MGYIISWPCTSICPSTIACELFLIDFTFWYCQNTTKATDTIVWGILRKPRWLPQHFDIAWILLWPRTLLFGAFYENQDGYHSILILPEYYYGHGHYCLGRSTKTKMATTAVWRLTLYPMQDIVCKRSWLKSACLIDFTFWYGLYISNTSYAIDLGPSTKTMIAATAVRRLALYPM